MNSIWLLTLNGLEKAEGVEIRTSCCHLLHKCKFICKLAPSYPDIRKFEKRTLLKTTPATFSRSQKIDSKIQSSSFDSFKSEFIRAARGTAGWEPIGTRFGVVTRSGVVKWTICSTWMTIGNLSVPLAAFHQSTDTPFVKKNPKKSQKTTKNPIKNPVRISDVTLFK